MSSNAKAQKDTTNHYEIAAKVMDFRKANPSWSNKEWEKAILVISREIDANRSKWISGRIPSPESPPNAAGSNKIHSGKAKAPSQSAKKPKAKQQVPAPNPAKQNAEYKQLAAQHLVLLTELKALGQGAGGANAAAIRDQIHSCESDMKILRGRPNAIAAEQSSAASSSSSSGTAGGPVPNKSSGLAQAHQVLTDMIARSTTPAQSGKSKYSTLSYRAAGLKSSTVLDLLAMPENHTAELISLSDRKAIVNGLNNSLYHGDDALIAVWEKARAAFEQAASHRAANGSSRLV